MRPYNRLQDFAELERETWNLERGTRWSEISGRGASYIPGLFILDSGFFFRKKPGFFTLANPFQPWYSSANVDGGLVPTLRKNR